MRIHHLLLLVAFISLGLGQGLSVQKRWMALGHSVHQDLEALKNGVKQPEQPEVASKYIGYDDVELSNEEKTMKLEKKLDRLLKRLLNWTIHHLNRMSNVMVYKSNM